MGRSGGIETDYHAPVEGDEKLEDSGDPYPEFVRVRPRSVDDTYVSTRDHNWREKRGEREWLERIASGIVFIIVLMAVLFVLCYLAG